MKDIIEQANKAKLILVPKGDDSLPCFRAFEEATGISVPEFIGRKLAAKSKGKTFLKVKGRDIPALIDSGYGDIGLTGSDSCQDYFTEGCNIAYESFGNRLCRFALLAPAGNADAIRKRLNDKSQNISVATSFPKLLDKCAVAQDIKLASSIVSVSGSVEIMPSLLGVELVADLVSTGTTSRINGLVEVKNLLDVYPAIVFRKLKDSRSKFTYGDIALIDSTLSKRNAQASDLSINSYTLDLFRNPNKAGKKAGEEFGETMMAIFGDGSIADCESEVADLIYAQLAAAYSKNKPLKLSNIIQILVERNQLGAKK